MNRLHPIAATLYAVLLVYAVLFVLVGCGPSVDTVARTTDRTKLAKIALEAKDERVRRAAVEKLTDQALLAKIAMETKGWSFPVRC